MLIKINLKKYIYICKVCRFTTMEIAGAVFHFFSCERDAASVSCVLFNAALANALVKKFISGRDLLKTNIYSSFMFWKRYGESEMYSRWRVVFWLGCIKLKSLPMGNEPAHCDWSLRGGIVHWSAGS